MKSENPEKQIHPSTSIDELFELLPENCKEPKIWKHIKETMQQPSSLLEYIPSIYRQGEFLNRFMAPFEKILLGRKDCLDLDEVTGLEIVDSTLNHECKCESLEHKIRNLHQVFTPKPIRQDQHGAPKEFLEWLSDWTGFILREDLTEKKQREFLANIVQLYKKRGTKKNLEELLEKFTGLVPRVVEEYLINGFQIGKTSTVGVDSIIGGNAPYFFTVTIAIEKKEKGIKETKRINRIRSIAKSLIEIEKPAHTEFKLEIYYPTMRIGTHSTIGIDTILGTHDKYVQEEGDE